MKKSQTNPEKEIKQIAKDAGAVDVGISGVDRLTSNASVESMDASYLLPNAKSIISVMRPLDDDIIRNYLGKKNQPAFQKHESDTYKQLYAIGQKIVGFLKSEGHQAVVAEPNLDYRYKDLAEYKKIPYKVKQFLVEWLGSDSIFPVSAFKKAILPALYETSFKKSIDWDLTPSFSHRYGAVAAGIGYIGWSGNVLHPDYGARVLYNTVITDCELSPDPMLEENPCDGCRICTKVCQSDFLSVKAEDRLTIGGKQFVHNKKAHNLRCIFVCAGFSGQNKHKGWSTWSPGRVTLPESDDDLEEFWKEFVKTNLWNKNYYSKVFADLLYHSEFGLIRKKEDRLATTCGNCQLVCWQTRKQRQENYEILINSGVVEEGENFSFKVVKNKST